MSRLAVLGPRTVKERLLKRPWNPFSRNRKGKYAQVVSLPKGATVGRLRFPRRNWAKRSGPGREFEVLQGEVDLSFDAGRTWQLHVVGFGTPGGDYFNRRGDLVVESVQKVPLAQPENSDRQLRVRLNCKSRIDLICDLDVE